MFLHFAKWLSRVVFRDSAEVSAGGRFHPLESSRVRFPSALTAAARSAGQGGDIYSFQKEYHAKRKIKFARYGGGVSGM